MSWKDRVAQIIKSSTLVPIYNLAGGLSEFWALVFGIATVVLAFKGKLDPSFAAAVTAITGILVAHDAIDGYLEHKKSQQ